MPQHRIYIDTVYAEDLLQLPENVFIRGATVMDGSLILIVNSEEDLGSLELNAVYGVAPEEKHVAINAFEPRKTE